ncbi:unnamed protein product [Polarella glacialis]|uniref:Fatty acid desaturase domain-containing protein n=1 Tax=Polarella glacialis TaxID=89957 RepID=A0A813G1W2_POLGL|nr:unnamed protein product [Polarella glacialis]
MAVSSLGQRGFSLAVAAPRNEQEQHQRQWQWPPSAPPTLPPPSHSFVSSHCSPFLGSSGPRWGSTSRCVAPAAVVVLAMHRVHLSCRAYRAQRQSRQLQHPERRRHVVALAAHWTDRGSPSPGVLGLEWMESLDLPAFAREVQDLGERLRAQEGPEDQAHFFQLVNWTHFLALLGLGTMWMTPNLLTVVCLSLWTWGTFFTTHFISHGGYNRSVAAGAGRGHYNSRGFAVDSRRWLDWFDWILPEAWNVHHNRKHHYRLNEDADPDFLERNFASSASSGSLVAPLLAMPFWKWVWLSPNSFKELKVSQARSSELSSAEARGFERHAPFTLQRLALEALEALGDWTRGADSAERLHDSNNNNKGERPFSSSSVVPVRELFLEALGPYLLWRFVVLPLPLLLAGPSFFFNAVGNLVLAELASNAHSYLIVLPNHNGNDLYRYGTSCKPKSPTFYLRSVISSANYFAGDDVHDFLHGWLNYQIEHHCWPDLSMLSYRRGRPELQKICGKHGVPYIEDSVFTRFLMTLDVVTGKAEMRTFPEVLERGEDLAQSAGTKPRSDCSF